MWFNVVNPGTTMPKSDDDFGPESNWDGGQARWWSEKMRGSIVRLYPLRRIGMPRGAVLVVFLASAAADLLPANSLARTADTR